MYNNGFSYLFEKSLPHLDNAFLNKQMISSRDTWTTISINVHNSYVFPFPTTDVQINSCKPDPTTTIIPSSSVPTDLTAYSSSDLTGNTTAVPTAAEPEQTLKNVKFRIICITETILPTEETTTTMPEESYTYPAAFRNDGVVFGGKGSVP